MTGREQGQGEGREPLDEEAAWAQIVAGYGAEPPDPPGVWAKPESRTGRDGDEPREPGREDAAEGREGHGTGEAREPQPEPGRHEDGREERDGAAPGGREEREGSAPGGREGAGAADDAPVRSFTVYSPGAGPRDWKAAEPSADEDHFIPPEPPPLPRPDTTTKFAWLAVLGGPALLLAAVLLQWDFTWWISVLGVGGFLGGFATLVTRLRDGDEDDWDDPGRGAVV
ncbi:hypothetical protein JJV70_05950 [Streptomyces sp. JJ66]|uniref:hypothetical protein n=1 Tax=Streptomyces sp. JJ66 TaxID=2803843 RepID=UPI001C59FD98|nr:hypothetical protein [Streptomyces sp. JJ66]MBW1601660.1 hypothetical protein [Streptomyces sp. JJ66]